MQIKIPKVVFLQIKTQQDKLSIIIKTATFHFENKKPLLFITADEKAEKFVDELLWKEPKFSFLPHNSSPIDLIVITRQIINTNSAKYIFNLTPEPISDFSFNIIYELDDFSKKQSIYIAKQKFNFYKSRKCLIEAR